MRKQEDGHSYSLSLNFKEFDQGCNRQGFVHSQVLLQAKGSHVTFSVFCRFINISRCKMNHGHFPKIIFILKGGNVFTILHTK